MKALHNEAMDLAELAFIERVKGQMSNARELFKKAFELEKQAAICILSDYGAEPSRSVLFRSAASLAMNFGDYREAEKMIASGLAGDPPFEIAEELRNLYEQINFERHFELKGIVIGADEMQMSMAGSGIGYGMVKNEEFVKRIDGFEKLTYRTAERKWGIPFREKGPVSKGIKEMFETFLSAPRAASFAVTIRVGKPSKQLYLEEEKNVFNVIEHMLKDLELLNNSKEDLLKESINDSAYFRNFIALAKKLAPDGENVNTVGFTILREGKARTIELRRTQAEISFAKKEKNKDEMAREEVVGQLSYADAKEDKIKLTLENKKQVNIFVPKGLMNDVVKPFWGDMVRIIGRRVEKGIVLDDITKDI
jgi:tetratricopeptide (TPR) repeat protein